MKQIFAISFLLLIGATSLSASQTDNLLGKWVLYKITKSKNQGDLSEVKNGRWVKLETDNVLWTGEGTNNKKRGNWWLDDDNKTLHLKIRSKDVPMKIQHLSKTKLILNIYENGRTLKAYWKKVPS